MLGSIIRCTDGNWRNGLIQTGGNLQKGHTVAKSFTWEEISQEYEQKRRDSWPCSSSHNRIRRLPAEHEKTFSCCHRKATII